MGMRSVRQAGSMIVSVLCACAMTIIGLIVVPVPSADAVESQCSPGTNSFAQCLPDAALAEAVAKAAGKQASDIMTQRDLQLTSLAAYHKGIKSVEGLGAFTNLNSLDLSSNEIADISALASLTAMKELRLYNNQIENISAVKNMPNLALLGMGNNKIADISATAVLSDLVQVNFSYNNISDTTPLRNCKKLQYIAVAGNKLTEIRQLNGYTNIIGIDASENPITDISGSTLKPEHYFVLTSSDTTEDVSVKYGGTLSAEMPIGPDGKHIAPYFINKDGVYDANTGMVTWTNVTDSVPHMAKFDIHVTDQSSDMPYSGVVRRNVKIQSVSTAAARYNIDAEPHAAVAATEVTHTCNVGSSTFSACLPDAALAAAVAQIVNKQPSDILTQEDVNGITAISASSKGIQSIAGLEHFTSLKSLVLDGNSIEDISPLRDLSSLEYVSFYLNGKISDVSPLANKPNMTGIALGGNNISYVESLVNLPKISWIDLYENKISDVSPLAKLKTLTCIWLASNNLHDVSSLGTLPNLARLQTEWNHISDMSGMKENSPKDYLMNANQVIELEKSVGEGESFEVDAPLDRFGFRIAPYAISNGGEYDSASGKIIWKNAQKSGNYQIRFRYAYDDDFLYAGVYNIDVKVDYKDKTKPTIWGAWDTYAPLGQPFDPMYAVTATDPEDGSVPVELMYNSVDTSKEGTYEVMYHAVDKSDNHDYFKRKVTVVKDIRITNIDAGLIRKPVGTLSLYKGLNVIWSNGATTMEGVIWDAVPESEYSRPNAFTVKGKCRGQGVEVQVVIYGEGPDTTVYFEKQPDWTSYELQYRPADGTFTPRKHLPMTDACGNWVKATVKNTNGDPIMVQFSDGGSRGIGEYYASNTEVRATKDKLTSGAPSCMVNYVPVESVAISGPGVRDGALTVEVDQAVQLTASVYPADATDRTVSWRSSDGSVVRSVNEWIRGLKPGTATITATAGGRSATLRVTVVK